MKKILFIISFAFAFSLFNSEIANADRIKIKNAKSEREVWEAVENIQEVDPDYEIKRVKIKHDKKTGYTKGKIRYKLPKDDY